MSIEPFFYQLEYRSAFLANMAGRLREVISDDCQELLKDKQVLTPVTDVSLVLFISQHDMSSIAEIARAMDYSHQRTASRMNSLEKMGIVSRHDDIEDTRCKRFCLTKLGKQDFIKLEKVYRSAAQALDGVFEELDDDLMEKLLTVVNSLKRLPLSARIQNQEELK